MVAVIRRTFDGNRRLHKVTMRKFRSEVNLGLDLKIDWRLDLGLDK